MQYEEHQEQMDSLKGQIPVLQIQITKKEKQKNDLKDYYRDIEEAKGRIEKVAIEIEKLQKQLPNTVSDTENLDLISNMASTINIKNPFLTPTEEEEKGFYVTKKYVFKGRGTFLQFLILLEKIGNSERILNIHSLKFSKVSEKQKGRFQLIDGELEIESYRHNPKFKEERGIDEIEKKFKTSNSAGS